VNYFEVFFFTCDTNEPNKDNKCDDGDTADVFNSFHNEGFYTSYHVEWVTFVHYQSIPIGNREVDCFPPVRDNTVDHFVVSFTVAIFYAATMNTTNSGDNTDTVLSHLVEHEKTWNIPAYPTSHGFSGVVSSSVLPVY